MTLLKVTTLVSKRLLQMELALFLAPPFRPSVLAITPSPFLTARRPPMTVSQTLKPESRQKAIDRTVATKASCRSKYSSRALGGGGDDEDGPVEEDPVPALVPAPAPVLETVLGRLEPWFPAPAPDPDAPVPVAAPPTSLAAPLLFLLASETGR